MIVYVETNFLIQLALQQDQWTFAERILAGSEEKKWKLKIPEFCIGEAFSRLAHDRADSNSVFQSMQSQKLEFHRPSMKDRYGKALTDVRSKWLAQQREEEIRLGQTVARLLNSCEVLQLSKSHINIAVESLIPETRGRLRLADALILSMVLTDASQGMLRTKLFVSTDDDMEKLGRASERLRKLDGLFEKSFSEAYETLTGPAN